MAKSDKPPAPINFEHAMGELDTLVEKMEQGEFSLEESIQQFERGMALARSCQRALSEAEQKVSQLTGTGEQEVLQDFVVPDDH